MGNYHQKQLRVNYNLFHGNGEQVITIYAEMEALEDDNIHIKFLPLDLTIKFHPADTGRVYSLEVG